MGYMTVQKHTDTVLCLLRKPTFLSKAVFVGFFFGVQGIILFGSESLFFKVLIGLGATCLSFLIVDNYEICEFDKVTSEVKLTRLHWCQYLLSRFRCGCTSACVKARLEEIQDVSIEEQEGNTSSKAYHVTLYLRSGIQLGVTEVFTTDDISEHEAIARLIRSFLGDLLPPEVNSEADTVSDDISSSEDDFEQISRAELDDLNETEESQSSNKHLIFDDQKAAGDYQESVPQEVEKADESGEFPS